MPTTSEKIYVERFGNRNEMRLNKEGYALGNGNKNRLRPNLCPNS
jgi:hypothetical protein